MKPIQSGALQTKDGLISQDACLMATAAGVDDKMDLINPICLREPLAPSVAAEVEGIKVDIEKIKRAYDRLKKMHDFIVVEGAGGIVVPITSDFLVADLVKMFDLPVIIISRPSLGTINHTVLTVEYARLKNVNVIGVIINGLDKKNMGVAEKTNPRMIEELADVPILGVVPHDPFVDTEKCRLGNMIELIENHVDLDRCLYEKNNMRWCL